MQNLSYIWELNGKGFVKGLKPAKNVGTKLIAQIQEIIKANDL